MSFDMGIQAYSKRNWIDLSLLAIVFTIWFGYGIGARALWSPDEGRYAEIPREMAESGDYLTPRLNGVKYFEKPPLVYWLTAGSIKWFGLQEWAFRLWPAILAIISCISVYLLGTVIYNRKSGITAAVVLATSPFYHIMAGALTLDMPLAALVTVSMTTFLIGVRQTRSLHRRLWLMCFYIFIALAVLTKGLIGIVIPGIVIGTWIMILGRWHLLREIHLPGGLLVFIIISAPWHVMVSTANPEFAWFYFVHEHLERYLTTVHQRYKPVWYFAAVLVLGMFPWSAFLPVQMRGALSRLWRDRQQHVDTWYLLLWATLPFIFFSASGSKLAPYILPVFPPLALLIGRTVSRIWDGSIGMPKSASWILLFLGTTGALLFAALPWLAAEKISEIHAGREIVWLAYGLAFAMLIAGSLPILTHRFLENRFQVTQLFASAVLVTVMLSVTLPNLDEDRSVKSLALSIKQDLRPNDEIANYRNYYQDLPVYIEKRITLVRWDGELEFGASVEDTSGWIINESAFYQRWLQPNRMYVFTSNKHQDYLRNFLPGPMCLLGSTNNVVMLVNRECDS
ncbi:MAG: glycosyl transferase [marine bacterium B5-7]|nr:MAG: glycosyl transferase [marine bacterium B5-7]